MRLGGERTTCGHGSSGRLPLRRSPAAARARHAVPPTVVAMAGNRYRQLERDLLPGGVPNTPMRRLSSSIKHAMSLRQLQRIYTTQSHKTLVFGAKHLAAMAMRIPALLYYRVVSDALSPASAQQLRALLSELALPLARSREALRLLEGTRIAQLLVVLAAVGGEAPPAEAPQGGPGKASVEGAAVPEWLVDALVAELMRDGAKKLPGSLAPSLLAELAAALVALRWGEAPLWRALAANALVVLQDQQQQAGADVAGALPAPRTDVHGDGAAEAATAAAAAPCDKAFLAVDVAMVAGALADAGLHEPALMTALAAAAAPRLALLTAEQLATLVTAFERLAHADVALAAAAAEEVGRRAAATLELRTDDLPALAEVARAAARVARLCPEPAEGAGRRGGEGAAPARVPRALARVAASCLGQLSPEQVARLAAACADAGAGPHVPLATALARRLAAAALAQWPPAATASALRALLQLCPADADAAATADPLAIHGGRPERQQEAAPAGAGARWLGGTTGGVAHAPGSATRGVAHAPGSDGDRRVWGHVRQAVTAAAAAALDGPEYALPQLLDVVCAAAAAGVADDDAVMALAAVTAAAATSRRGAVTASQQAELARALQWLGQPQLVAVVVGGPVPAGVGVGGPGSVPDVWA